LLVYEKQHNNTFESLRKAIEERIREWKTNATQYYKQLYKEIDSGFGFVGRTLGKYPVIFITFEEIEDIPNEDQEYVLDCIRTAIKEAYK
jgi:hypothetical protein